MAMELFARDSISSSECEGGQREILCAHSSNNDDKTGGITKRKTQTRSSLVCLDRMLKPLNGRVVGMQR